MSTFEHAAIRILYPSNYAAGTGFLITPDLALTCAHVVSAALLNNTAAPVEAPGGEIRLDFPLLAAGQVLQTRLHAWAPQADVALLRIEGALPVGAAPVELLRADDLWGHALRAFGFPQTHPQGDWAEGKLLAANAWGWLEINGTEKPQYFIQPGFSGGAVWDETLRGVVGMVNAADKAPGGKQAYCLPAGLLVEACPELAFCTLTPMQRLRRGYLAHLRRTYHALDFKGIPQLDNFARELPLEAVYVPLLARPELPGGETWERRMLAGRYVMEEEMLPPEVLAAMEKQSQAAIPIEEAIQKNPLVVVLGNPGSGKSTLVKRLALRLAGEPSGRLPIPVPLNAYAAALLRGDLSLQAYLAQYFAGLSKDLAGLEPLFDEALQNGQALALLDGLDEVQEQRSRLVNKVEIFAAEAAHKGNQVVVTSRLAGYRDCPLNAKDWALHTLLDFDRPAIEAFARQWCLAFETSTLGDTPEAQAQAENERKALLAALDANPGVARLATNPLLLTILALVKRQSVTLPNQRVKLYDLYLETLINAWSKARALDKQQVGPELNYEQTLQALGPLALWLRQENPTAGLVSEGDLVKQLTHYFMGEDWGLARGPARERAAGLLSSVHQYSNLLLERAAGQYGFIHLTLENMLAAYGVVQAGQVELDKSLAIIGQRLTDPAWRETLLLAVGIWGLVNKSPRLAGKVVQAMLEMDCPGETPCHNLLLAGACLEDVGLSGLDRPSAERVLEALERTALDRSLPPPVQRDAGFVLGRLAGGSPELLDRIRPDLDDFVLIPAGKFLYGEENKQQTINQPFEIARYPVTNLQYRRFVEAGGYEQRQFWSEAGWAWRTGESDSKAKGDMIGERAIEARPVDRRGVPAFWQDMKWNNPLAPVVGTCWYEAEAYCNWLAQESGRAVRLPTEQEWECAARGTQGRVYPWGDEFERGHLNCAEFWEDDDQLDWSKWYRSKSSEQASTTLVGQFPAGRTPESICDLGGNVWEWTGSWNDQKEKGRVLRGGAWYNFRNYARSALRGGWTPIGWDDSFSFRCVRSG